MTLSVDDLREAGVVALRGVEERLTALEDKAAAFEDLRAFDEATEVKEAEFARESPVDETWLRREALQYAVSSGANSDSVLIRARGYEAYLRGGDDPRIAEARAEGYREGWKAAWNEADLSDRQGDEA